MEKRTIEKIKNFLGLKELTIEYKTNMEEQEDYYIGFTIRLKESDQPELEGMPEPLKRMLGFKPDFEARLQACSNCQNEINEDVVGFVKDFMKSKRFTVNSENLELFLILRELGHANIYYNLLEENAEAFFAFCGSCRDLARIKHMFLEKDKPEYKLFVEQENEKTALKFALDNFKQVKQYLNLKNETASTPTVISLGKK